MLDSSSRNNKRKEISAQLLIPPKFFNLNKVDKGDMIYFPELFDKVPKTELNKYFKELNIDKEDVENLAEVNCQFLGLCKFETTKFNVGNFLISIKHN